MKDWIEGIAFILIVFVIGFMFGGIFYKIRTGTVKEHVMVEYNLAHYHEKTKEFVADSLEFKNDTIIIRKKSN